MKKPIKVKWYKVYVDGDVVKMTLDPYSALKTQELAKRNGSTTKTKSV